MRGLKNNKGITMIELVISMAILGIAGLMAAGVLSTSFRMYQSTVTNADLQRESQTISRRIAGVLINAKNLWIEESTAGTFLFTGTITEKMGKTLYEGEIIWFEEGANSLYYKADAFIEVLANPESVTAQTVRPLTAVEVKAVLEKSSDVKEYLISENIESLTYRVFPEPKEADRIQSSDFYTMEEKVTVNYELVLSDFNGDNYVVNSSTTPRNTVRQLYLKKVE